MLLITTLSVPPTSNGKNASSSIYELAFNLISKNYTTIDNETKIKIINKIKEVLQNGSTYNSINNKIQRDKIYNNDYNKFLDSTKQSGEINLIRQDIFYYHNELRVFPEAPEVYFDLNTGTYTREPFEYFLEMKASYTTDDLYDYLRSKLPMCYVIQNKNRLVGGLNSLIQKHGIEKVLFMIDTTDRIYSNNKRYAKNIFEIEEFYRDAEDNYNMKMSESVVNNTNKIVLKKRKLFEEKSEM